MKPLPKIAAFGITLATLSVPLSAAAHVKWYAKTGPAVEPYQLTEPAVLAAILAMAVALGLSWFVGQKMSAPSWLTHTGKRYFRIILEIAIWLIAAWPIITALQKHVLLPTITLAHIGSAVGILMLATGLATLFPVTRKYSSLGWVVLWGYLAWQLGILGALEHVFILGIALALWSWPFNAHVFATTPLWAIRLSSGLSLIMLGLQEKLLHPELAQHFLATKPHFNFMQHMGMSWFDDRLFILSAGSTELYLGIAILAGLATRLNTLLFAGVLIVTAIALGPQEVIGHLPLFGIGLLLIVYGNGKETLRP